MKKEDIISAVETVLKEYYLYSNDSEIMYYSIESQMAKIKLSQKSLIELSLKKRERLINHLRHELYNVTSEFLEEGINSWAQGNIKDKLTALETILDKTTGMEGINASVFTGDDGLTLIEHSPYGIIASYLPLQNIIETMVCQMIGMLSSGNGIMFIVPKQAYPICQKLISAINQTISDYADINYIIGLSCYDDAVSIFNHNDVNMNIITNVNVASLNLPIHKKTIITGIASVPVIVDETADIEKAAKDVVKGASFDNGQLFIAENVLIIVNAVYDFFMHHLFANGAVLLSENDAQHLNHELENNPCPRGLNADEILSLISKKTNNSIQLLLVETTDIQQSFDKYLGIPVLPVLRANDVNHAIELAKTINLTKHTAIMHSKHIDHLTKCAKELQVILFIKNAPSYAGIGICGEVDTTYTIAGVTGEGNITSKHYSRIRYCILSEGFLIK